MKRFILLLIIILLFSMNGCVVKKIESTPEKSPYIVYGITAFPEDFSQLSGKKESDEELMYALFEGLVTMNSKGDIIPAIAESWNISEDGITYTFKLNESAKWSDGATIKAEDFVEFFSEMFSPSAKNKFYPQLSCIYGLEDYHSGKVTFNKVAIRTLEGNKLEIRLNKPYGDLLKVLSQPVFGLRVNGQLLRNWKDNYQQIKYSGAFIIKSFDKNIGILIGKNRNYRNSYDVTEEQFLLKVNENIELALAEFETGKIDILADPPVSEVNRMLKSEDTLVVNTSNVIGIEFNFSGKSIGSSVSFRTALRKILSPEDIAEKHLQDFTFGGANYLGETVNVFKNNSIKYNSEPDEAKFYIGDIPEQQLKDVKMIALDNDKNKKILKAVSDTVKENLGISASVKLYGEAELEEAIGKGDYDLLLSEYKSEYDKDMSLLNRWTTGSKANNSRYSNLEYDKAVSNANMAAEIEKRKQYINMCQNILQKDLPYIPLFNDVSIILKNSFIEGVNVNIFGNIDFKNIKRL